MCTVTWFHSQEGYQLFFNRDESPDRKSARPPEKTIESGMPVLMPRDGDHGGSWIAVNRAGMSLALLNDYPSAPTRPPKANTSRGLLLTAMISSRSVSELRDRLSSGSMTRFEPWILLALVPHEPALIFRWNGVEISEEKEGTPRLLVSSSWNFGRVAAYRRKWFQRLTSDGRSLDPEDYLRFHRHREAGFESESVCTLRDSARTVSATRIIVDGALRRIEYCPGPPCQTAFAEALSMNDHD